MPSFEDLFRRKKGTKKQPKPDYANGEIKHSLCTSRPRALTLPLSSTVSVQWTSPQSTSLLLRLPLELRRLIYEAVLGHRKVHMTSNRRPRPVRTLRGNEVFEWRWWHHICTRNEVKYDVSLTGSWEVCPSGRVDSGPGTIQIFFAPLDFALLLTCRMVYSEAINVLYTTTTFCFTGYRELSRLSTRVLANRFASITSIKQTWNIFSPDLTNMTPSIKTACNDLLASLAALASMPNLRFLKMTIFACVCPNPIPASLKEAWIDPLQRFRGKAMEKFEIWVPESFVQHFEAVKEAKFEVKSYPDFQTIV